MLQHRKLLLSAGLLALGFLLLSGAAITAGEKKADDKKVDKKKSVGPKSAGALLSKSAELKEEDEKDTKITKSPCKIFPIKLMAGKSYQIDLKSQDFDAFLRLLDAQGAEIAFDDDSGGFPDARIIYKAAKTGDYKIVVTSFDGKAGNFKLTAVEVAAKQGATAGSRFQAKPIDLILKGGNVTYPGELNDKDPMFQNHYYKVFVVQMEKDKTYRIDHRNRGDDPKFDPFLILEDSKGTQLEVNDDINPPALDARIVFKAAKTGAYRIVTTTLPPRQTGKFTLEIGPADAKETKEADLKFRINGFSSLTPAQRKGVVEEIRKRLLDKDGDLAIVDAQLAFMLAMEAEVENVELARIVYKDAIKYFSAAKDEKIVGVTRQFESALKNLEKIGTGIEISGKTIDGKDFDLKNLKGKVVLVDFWGTWCGPCVAEIPNMLEAYEKFHKRGFEIIGVAKDKNDDIVTKFLEARMVPWACINIEDSQKLIEMHNVNSYPTALLVDQSGRVISLRARGPLLERHLERLLKVKK